MNIYVEVSRNAWLSGRLKLHLDDINYYVMDSHDLGHSSILIASNRAWIEDTDGVRYLKNRMYDVDSCVDMEEFLAVKLRARSLSLLLR